MNIVYAKEEFPQETTSSIFLAGPTPRSNDVLSWRPQAIKALSELGYSGDVLVPEPRDGVFSGDYDGQVNWELKGLERADIIVFWVPRDMTHMPALTTNVEFGLWIKSGKCVLGFPENAEKMRYLEHHAKEQGLVTRNTLKDTLMEALTVIGEGAKRLNGECTIPLHIWKTKHFQTWYTDMKEAGNTLNSGKVEWAFIPNPSKRTPFFWSLKANVRVESEDRNKEIEVVISRPHTSSIVLYKQSENILDTEIVLVREFRTPVSNNQGYVWELPGGSDPSDIVDPKDVAIKEIEEETSLRIEPTRLQLVNRRQLASTTLANKVSLYSAKLTQKEVDEAKKLKNVVQGDHAATEYTYVEVVTLRQILDEDLVDWANIGMITQVLYGE